MKYVAFLILSALCFFSIDKKETQTTDYQALPFGAKCYLEALPGTIQRSTPAPARRGACAHFDITFNSFGGVPQEVQDAVNYAAEIWAGLIASPETIKVTVAWIPLPGSTLGVALPNGVKNFQGAPMQDVWYPVAMANARLSTDLKPGEDDMTVYLTSSANWYTGIDAMPPVTQQDLVSVAMHEIGHGLGFASISGFDASNNFGSFGLIDSTDFPPTSFPFPKLDTLPSAYDAMLIHGNSGAQLVDEENPSFPLGLLLTSDDIFFEGANATAAYGAQNPPIFAPGTYAPGTSISHLDNATFANDSINGLMSPFSTAGTAHHDPGPIVMGVLQDLGWPLCTGTAIKELFSWEESPAIRYGPDGEVMLSYQTEKPLPLRLSVFDLNGKEVLNQVLPPSFEKTHTILDISHLETGIYGYKVNGNGLCAGGKMLVQ